jgi:hypothetical protein
MVLSRTGIDVGLLSAYRPRVAFSGSDRSRIATTPNFAWRPGTDGEAERSGPQERVLYGKQRTQEPVCYILAQCSAHRVFQPAAIVLCRPQSYLLKSNPYLSSKFTGSDSLHPQWVSFRPALPKSVNAIPLLGRTPYAAITRAEYWVGKDALDFDRGPEGVSESSVRFGEGAQEARSRSNLGSPYFHAVLTRVDDRILEHPHMHGSEQPQRVGYAFRDSGGHRGCEWNIHGGNAGRHSRRSRRTLPHQSILAFRADERHGAYQHSGFDLSLPVDSRTISRNDSGDHAVRHARGFGCPDRIH